MITSILVMCYLYIHVAWLYDKVASIAIVAVTFLECAKLLSVDSFILGPYYQECSSIFYCLTLNVPFHYPFIVW